jgi:hypothetical protein
MNWEGRGIDRSVTEDIIPAFAAGTKKSHENRSQERFETGTFRLQSLILILQCRGQEMWRNTSAHPYVFMAISLSLAKEPIFSHSLL